MLTGTASFRRLNHRCPSRGPGQLARSAWESVQSGPSIWPDLRSGLSVSDRESPRFTRVDGPLMARWLDHAAGRPSAFQAGHIPSCSGSCECCALSPVAAACRWSLLLLSPLLSIQRRPSRRGRSQMRAWKPRSFKAPRVPRPSGPGTLCPVVEWASGTSMKLPAVTSLAANSGCLRAPGGWKRPTYVMRG